MSYHLEICKSQKKKKTPSIFVKHFKRSFSALNISNRKPKLINVEYSHSESVEIPKIIYLPPKNQAIYSVIIPECEHFGLEKMSSNSSFQLYLPGIALDEDYKQGRTPEKYLTAGDLDWKTVNPVALVKRRNQTNLCDKEATPTKSLTEIKLLKMCESEKSIEKKTFGKKYIKRKLAKLFRSSGKINETHIQDEEHCSAFNIQNDEPEVNINQQNEALRNLSFTTAIMSDGKKSKERNHVDYKTEHHVKQISTSTLRFWKKPTEEKFKACQRRTQDNFYNLNKASSRLKSITNNINISSEISWYNEERRLENSENLEKMWNKHAAESVSILGGDPNATETYNLENYYENVDIRMKNSQSAGNINSLSRTDSIFKSTNNDEYWKSCQSDGEDSVEQKNFSPTTYFKATENAVSYSGGNGKAKLKSKRKSSKQSRPKPPTRSDSLFRSLELICNKLQSSISKSPSDSFRNLKNQYNYQEWLKSLPYRQENQSSSSIKMRPKMTKRHCVSEVLNAEIPGLGVGEEHQHSCPTLKFDHCADENSPFKMSNSHSDTVIKKSHRNDDVAICVGNPSLRRSNSLDGLGKSFEWNKRLSANLESSYSEIRKHNFESYIRLKD